MHTLLKTKTGLVIHHTPSELFPDKARSGGAAAKVGVLLVHGYGQNRHAWHLPSRSFADALALAGFEVFNLELRGHGASRESAAALGHARSIEEYVDHDLPEAVAYAKDYLGEGARLFVMGHSLGGLVSYAAAPSLLPMTDGLVTLGSPFAFAKGSRPLRALSELLHLVERIPNGKGGRPHFSVGLSLFRKPILLSHRLHESSRYPSVLSRLLVPVRPWHVEAIEPHVLSEHVEHAFDRVGLGETLEMFAWAKDARFAVGANDYATRFESWTKPLLVIAGTHDELAPPEGVRKAHEVTRAKDTTYLEVPHGHIDMLVGTRAPEHVWDRVISWIRARL
ncbi:MAG: alpha/beta hydrolase [Polyangiaceae bacterium]